MTISTILVFAGLYFVTKASLPHKWLTADGTEAFWYYALICASMGLVSGLLIGYSTDYYTSNAHHPVYEMA